MDKEKKDDISRIFYTYLEFDSNAKICMYLPLDYFLNDLKEHSIFFTKRKMFMDHREETFHFGQLFAPVAIGENVPPQTINQEDLQKRMDLFGQYKEYGNLLTSCWTLREDENYLMWDSYAKKKGVRIMTSIDKFVYSLKTNDYEVLCGRINYQKYDINKGLERNLYTKEKFFSNEEEFRFYLFPVNEEVEKQIVGSEDRGFAIPFSWNNLAPEILISPFYSKESALCIKQELQQKYGFLDSVNLSEINLNI